MQFYHPTSCPKMELVKHFKKFVRLEVRRECLGSLTWIWELNQNIKIIVEEVRGKH